MERLWAEGPVSLANLHRALAEESTLAYTTVATELSRLVKKGFVVKSGAHLETRYAAAFDRASFVERFVGAVVGDLVGAHRAATIHGFVAAIANDDAALEQTLRLIHERRNRS